MSAVMAMIAPAPALTAGLFDGDAYDSIEWESAITEWTYPTDARLTAAVFDVGTILEGPVENFEGVWDSW